MEEGHSLDTGTTVIGGVNITIVVIGVMTDGGTLVRAGICNVLIVVGVAKLLVRDKG